MWAGDDCGEESEQALGGPREEPEQALGGPREDPEQAPGAPGGRARAAVFAGCGDTG
jgi:hypothetical protein